MAYNEKLDNMNSNMAINAANNNAQANSNFINIGLNALSNINNIVEKLDEDRANDLIDEANNKMVGYINTSQNEYMYDSEGRIIDDAESLMNNLYNKADEISSGYSGRYNDRISSALKSTINARSDSIYSSYANTLVAERKKSINNLMESEIALFDSGKYPSLAIDKFNELVDYQKNHPEDEEMKSIIESIENKLSDSNTADDIFADISYGLFIKKCNINGMSKSERERIYGDDVKKSIYQESLLTGFIYSDEFGYESQVFSGDMNDEEWITSAIAHDKEFGYTINGERHEYTLEELQARKQKYQIITNEMKDKYNNLCEKILQSKQDYLIKQGINVRNFIVELGSPEAFLDWLTEPTEIDGETVSVNRKKATESDVYDSWNQTLYDAQVTNELYSYVEDIKNAFSNENPDDKKEISNIEYAISKQSPEVQTFYNNVIKKMLYDKDSIMKIDKVSLNAMYRPNVVGSNINTGNLIGNTIDDIDSKNYMNATISSLNIKSSEEALEMARNASTEEERNIYLNKYANLFNSESEQTKQTNYENALLEITEVYFGSGKSYSKLFENGEELFNEISYRNNLTQYQKDTLRNILMTDQSEIDYNNASSDSMENLIVWYYNTGIANNYQYSESEIDKKATELKVDKSSSSYKQLIDGVRKITAENEASLKNQSTNIRIQKYYNQYKSYDRMSKDIDFINKITSDMDDTARQSLINTIEAKAEEERTGKKLTDGLNKFNEWYYLTDDGTERTYEVAVRKAGELGLDLYNSEVRSVLDNIMKNQSSKIKSDKYTVSYNSVQRNIDKYREENGGYEGITEDILKTFDGASDLTDAQISSIWTDINGKIVDERLKAAKEAETQAEMETLQNKNEEINSAKVELEKKLINSDISTYNEAVDLLVNAGASNTEAESYILAHFPSLLKQDKVDLYTNAAQHVIDYVNTTEEYKQSDIESWLVDKGYNATARERILSFAEMISEGYNNVYSAKEIALGLLGENDSLTYIHNQNDYTASLPQLLIGDVLTNAERGTEIYISTLNNLEYQLEEEIYGIVEGEGEDAVELCYQFVKDNFNGDANVEDFYEGMNVSYIVQKYMLGKVAEDYIENYRSFSDRSKNYKYDESRTMADVFSIDSNRYKSDIETNIHKQKIEMGIERPNINDLEYYMYSEGGVCYNKILKDIMSAESLEEAQIILRNYDKYLPEKESKNLYDSIENLNINSLLKTYGIDKTYEQLFSNIAGVNTDYFDCFSTYIANHPNEYNNLIMAIKQYQIDVSNNNINANANLLDSFTSLYTNMATSMMKTSQPKGILGIKSGDYLLGDLFSGQSKNEKYTSRNKDGKYNENFGTNIISAFAGAISSITNGDLGENALILSTNIKKGNLGNLTEDSRNATNSLNGLIYDTNNTYKNNELETFSLAVSILSSGYPLYVNINRLNEPKYIKTLKNDVCLALQDINGNVSSGYEGDFSTIINSAAILVNDSNLSRKYKNLSTQYSEGMKFEGYNEYGNITTRNGSTVNAIYDYGGHLSSLSVTYNDDKGNENTIDDLDIHDSKSTSRILKSIGVSDSRYSINDFEKEYGKDVDDIAKFNYEEYVLKGKNAYLIVPVINYYSYGASYNVPISVSYKKIKYSEVDNMLKDDKTMPYVKSFVEGIF